MDIDQYKKDLSRHEGIRSKPYDDATGKEFNTGDTLKGKLTIGVGINLHEGLDSDEILALLSLRVNRLLKELYAAMPWIADLPEPAQRAVADMHFNMGLPRLMTFRKMLTALQEGRFKDAATEALDSRWAQQVGQRAIDNANLFKECV
ncbi:glycoside hydrolase family protein [Terasakiella sp.]|uniref:glycoside hydrolase family protein n=1 Tax=Terasakiella sp. TaxID=2034861 RepID=UPI003AA8E146